MVPSLTASVPSVHLERAEELVEQPLRLSARRWVAVGEPNQKMRKGIGESQTRGASWVKQPRPHLPYLSSLGSLQSM